MLVNKEMYVHDEKSYLIKVSKCKKILELNDSLQSLGVPGFDFR
jgi:hypothetical protein